MFLPLKEAIILRTTLAALIGILVGVMPAAAVEPVACGGRDMIPELKKRAPEIYQEIRRDADTIVNGKGLLWRIEADGVAPSYLFGTIHFTDLRVHEFPPAVLAALDGSRVVIVESLSIFENPLSPAAKETAGLAQLPDGQTLDDILPPDVLATLKKALSRRLMAYGAFRTMKPWMLMQLLSYPPCELASLVLDNPIVDRDIGQRARDAGKEVIGLETAAEQLRSLDAVPMDSQIKMLLASAVLSKQTDDMHETFVHLYRAGDIAMVDMLSRKVMDAVYDAASYKDFMENLLDKRNVRMRDRAMDDVRKGGAFIAVGALHLPGEAGLVELFRGAGFSVTRVE